MNLIKTRQSDLTFILLLILGIISLVFSGGFKTVEADEIQNGTETVTVYAAAGTMTTLQQAADAYEAQTQRKVVINFASSSTLARQLTAGAEFDVFLSANSKWMDHVQEKGLIANDTRRDLLTDKLALVTPIGKTSDPDRTNRSIQEILLSSGGSIAIGDPEHVPCGVYAKEALTAMGCWENIQERIVPAASVRVAQQYIESGQCELGIVYYSGASQSDKVNIIDIIDPSLHAPIQFCAAAAVNSTNGNDFLDFLKRPAAERIFLDAGFSTVPMVPLEPDHNTSFTTPVFHANEKQAFMISLKVAATCTLVVAAPGILLGCLLARKSFPGRSVVNALVHLPMVIPPVVIGYLALAGLGKNSLLGGFLYETFGISFAFTWLGAVFVSAVMGFPLLVRSVKTAVEMIDSRYTDAANTLGSGPVRTFFTVIIPLAGPGIFAGLILAFARSLGEFGATAMFAGNIPGKTQTLSLAIFNFTQIPGAESSAMRLAGLSILLSLAAMLGSELLAHRMKSLLGAHR